RALGFVFRKIRLPVRNGLKEVRSEFLDPESAEGDDVAVILNGDMALRGVVEGRVAGVFGFAEEGLPFVAGCVDVDGGGTVERERDFGAFDADDRFVPFSGWLGQFRLRGDEIVERARDVSFADLVLIDGL